MKYYIEDYSGPEDAFSLQTIWDRNLRYAAEEAAKNYHNYHDGWESDWPLTIVLLDDGGIELGKFIVEREAVPEFYATKIIEGIQP